MMYKTPTLMYIMITRQIGTYINKWEDNRNVNEWNISCLIRVHLNLLCSLVNKKEMMIKKCFYCSEVQQVHQIYKLDKMKKGR